MPDDAATSATALRRLALVRERRASTGINDEFRAASAAEATRTTRYWVALPSTARLPARHDSTRPAVCISSSLENCSGGTALEK